MLRQRQWIEIGNYSVWYRTNKQGTANIFVKKQGCDFCMIFYISKKLRTILPLSLIDNDDIEDVQNTFKTLNLHGEKGKESSRYKKPPAVYGTKWGKPPQALSQYIAYKHLSLSDKEIQILQSIVHHYSANKLDNRLINLIILNPKIHDYFHANCKSLSTPEQLVEIVRQLGFPKLIELYGTVGKAKLFQPADLGTYRERIKLEFFQSEAEYTAFIRDITLLICD